MQFWLVIVIFVKIGSGKVVFSHVRKTSCVYACTVKRYDIYKAKTGLVQSAYHVAECSVCSSYTGCPPSYRTRHFFNNTNTNEDIATKFEQEYVRCVRNEKECVCSAPNCCDTEQRGCKIIKEMPGSVASGTHCTIQRLGLYGLCTVLHERKANRELMFIYWFICFTSKTTHWI